jgi:REP element-mobilizing transposase RayT
MPQPIVIAHHLIWTAYGWWLPNDPRGSMSHSIRNDVIAELGKLHYGRKRVQPASAEIRSFYAQAASHLKHPLLTFATDEVEAIATAFRDTISNEAYTCYACAIMPDHIHILIRKHKHRAEAMIEHLQHNSRLRLLALKLRASDHPTWGGPGYKVFLDHPDELHRTIRYIDDNPIKMRLPCQQWNFVKPYDN